MDWNKVAEGYLVVADEVFRTLREPVEGLAVEVAERLTRGGKILCCGNGGSAADAQHFTGEMIGRFLLNRRPYPAVTLSADTSVLTSLSNDFGFETVFERQVRALGKADDVLIAFSTSGASENACRALTEAKAMGLLTVAFLGGSGGRMAGLADRVLCIGSTRETPRIQEGHQLLMHLLAEAIEERLR